MTASELVFLLAGRVSRSCYIYLADAIELVAEDDEYLLCTTKVLYPYLAKRSGATARSVDRAIARAVADCWDHGDRAFLEQIACRKLVEKPSPKDFLCMAARYLKLQQARSAQEA